MVDYQGTRQSIGRARISTVPTLLQREGVFTEEAGGAIPKIYDPATTKPGSSGGLIRDPFPNNSIPATQLHRVAKLLLERYPHPTASGTANNYRRVGNEEQHQDQFDVRIDDRFSPRDQLFGRFSYTKDVSDPVAPLPDGSGNIGSGVVSTTRTTGYSFASSYFHAAGSGAAYELRAGYTRRSVDRKALLLDAPPGDSLRLPGIPSNAAFENALPTFVVSGFQQLGPPSNANADFRTDVTQILGTRSVRLGRHFLKAGFDRLQGEVAGQDHIGQEGMHEPDDDRGIGEENAERRGARPDRM